METTLKGTVRYDGGAFGGWQRQANRDSVQARLEDTLGRIARVPVAVQGAGRTDAGVHALGQVFSCRWPGTPPPHLRESLCKILRPQISITALETAPDDFSARFSATSKRYVYALDLARAADPFTARHAWHVPHRVDLDLLRELTRPLLGRHDFAGFQSAGSQMKTTIRTIHEIRLEPGGILSPVDARDHWRLVFHGDAFLYKMVRNITGTLVEVARGRFPQDIVHELLASPGPFLGHCAPAHGLALLEVRYDGPRRKRVEDPVENAPA
jgi:tRNA pseudouridine38-40 synthase